MNDPSELEPLLERLLGPRVHLIRRTTLGGGSISRTERLDTDRGRFVFKTHPDPPDGFFEAEAQGLEALRQSGTSLTIPRVVARADAPIPCLLLEYLEPGPPTADFDERLGRGLAELHRFGSTRFGFARENYCGTTPQQNPWTPTWIAFYGAARLAPQAARARDAGLLTADDARRLGTLIAHLDRWIAEPPEGPALIHGDLWSGNVHRTPAGHPVVLDPAVSFAHREAELGMMTLFGGFGRRVFAAYGEAFPLDSDWQERNDLYQLYHLLNHLNLFGAEYYGGVMRIVARWT